MHSFSARLRLALFVIAACLLAANPALAEKPPWAGGKKDKEIAEKQEERGNGKGKSDNKGGKGEHRYFTSQHRDSLHAYFSEQFRAGKGDCPPGLAKKRNGCLPPGQAKKWAIGKPLPKDVVIFDLPDTVIIKLGKPPEGQRFVRVAQDILLIAVGTNMVMDAIEDLNWEFGK